MDTKAKRLRKTNITNYVLRLIRENRKILDEVFAQKFNVFHNWTVGSLKDVVIKEKVIERCNNPDKTMVLESNNPKDYEEFSFLMEAVNDEIKLITNSLKSAPSNSIKPEQFTHDNWSSIRERYFKVKKENAISHAINTTFDNENNKKDVSGTFCNDFLKQIELEVSNAISSSSNSLFVIVSESETEENCYHLRVVDRNLSKSEAQRKMKKIAKEIYNYLSLNYFNVQIDIKEHQGHFVIDSSFESDMEDFSNESFLDYQEGFDEDDLSDLYIS